MVQARRHRPLTALYRITLLEQIFAEASELFLPIHYRDFMLRGIVHLVFFRTLRRRSNCSRHWSHLQIIEVLLPIRTSDLKTNLTISLFFPRTSYDDAHVSSKFSLKLLPRSFVLEHFCLHPARKLARMVQS